ncbi:HAD-IA family hydrolase [Methylophilus sp. 'Pure River']|uniref:HAD-IA family hydrolase n=1 Tax=Methylophilus sp. 'Pure River' TaxID=3377117 RepID=UPI00398F8755
MDRLCVIFDLDGTLVDSEGLCNQAFLNLLPQLNDTLDTLIQGYRGKKLAPILTDIEHRLGHTLPNTFEPDYRQHVADLFSRELKPIPGVLEMLNAIHVPKCIASSGPLLKIRQALQVSGLASYFDDNLFSSYDVGSWKPEPHLFLHAAHAMGFKPHQCVVVEDSDVGVEAATAAGIKVLQYSKHGESRLYPTKAHLCFDDMLKLPALLTDLANMPATLSYTRD